MNKSLCLRYFCVSLWYIDFFLFRTPSPAQGTAWLTNSANGSQIKGAPTVLSSPVRGATVTGKPQTMGRPQPTQPMPTIRSGTLLSSAISLGQTVCTFTYLSFVNKII